MLRLWLGSCPDATLKWYGLLQARAVLRLLHVAGGALIDVSVWAAGTLAQLVGADICRICGNMLLRYFRVRNQDGKLPIDCAVDGTIFPVNPSPWPTPTRTGPFRCTCALRRTPPDVEDVQYLVERHPEALDVQDKTGRLPIHCAVFGADADALDFVRYLAEKSPQSLRAKDRDGMMIPLHVAASSSAALDVIFYLASTDPESFLETRVVEESGRRPPSKRVKVR
jgi:hypothetical protein